MNSILNIVKHPTFWPALAAIGAVLGAIATGGLFWVAIETLPEIAHIQALDTRKLLLENRNDQLEESAKKAEARRAEAERLAREADQKRIEFDRRISELARQRDDLQKLLDLLSEREDSLRGELSGQRSMIKSLRTTADELKRSNEAAQRAFINYVVDLMMVKVRRSAAGAAFSTWIIPKEFFERSDLGEFSRDWYEEVWGEHVVPSIRMSDWATTKAGIVPIVKEWPQLFYPSVKGMSSVNIKSILQSALKTEEFLLLPASARDSLDNTVRRFFDRYPGIVSENLVFVRPEDDKFSELLDRKNTTGDARKDLAYATELMRHEKAHREAAKLIGDLENDLRQPIPLGD